MKEIYKDSIVKSLNEITHAADSIFIMMEGMRVNSGSTFNAEEYHIVSNMDVIMDLAQDSLRRGVLQGSTGEIITRLGDPNGLLKGGVS